MPDRFHYTMCGLTDVYLDGGFEVLDTPRGRRISVQDQVGLHRAIGRYLIELSRGLTGAELRFLREELNLSQVNLARLLGESDQSVARREKRPNPEHSPLSQDRILRYLYRESLLGANVKLTDFLRELATADNEADIPDAVEKVTFEECSEGWRRAA